jgi:hypothetical protein
LKSHFEEKQFSQLFFINVYVYQLMLGGRYQYKNKGRLERKSHIFDDKSIPKLPN